MDCSCPHSLSRNYLDTIHLPPPQTVSSSRQGRSESPVYTNLQELKITQANQPPVPSGSPVHMLGDWETYKDQNGRHYYYNRSTRERTWKPPRARDASIGNSRGESHSTGESSEVRGSHPQAADTAGNVLQSQEIQTEATQTRLLHLPETV